VGLFLEGETDDLARGGLMTFGVDCASDLEPVKKGLNRIINAVMEMFFTGFALVIVC
jgi:hypothetical protein